MGNLKRTFAELSVFKAGTRAQNVRKSMDQVYRSPKGSQAISRSLRVPESAARGRPLSLAGSFYKDRLSQPLHGGNHPNCPFAGGWTVWYRSQPLAVSVDSSRSRRPVDGKRGVQAVFGLPRMCRLLGRPNPAGEMDACIRCGGPPEVRFSLTARSRSATMTGAFLIYDRAGEHGFQSQELNGL